MFERGDKSKDKSERWLLQHQAGSILRLAGISGFTTWTVEESSLIAPRRLPDGLVNVNFPDREKPVPVLIEIESYANKDAERQMFEDLLLARLELGVIPEGICVVLQPKGRVRVREKMVATSTLGTSEVLATWKVVEVWNLKAEDLLAQNDLGLLPLVPLAKITGPAEPILQECRERIDLLAPQQRAEAYRVVTQLLASMVHPTALLKRIFLGGKPMIETPILFELEAEYTQRTILRFLRSRFSRIPKDVRAEMLKVYNLKSLDTLTDYGATCKTLSDFRELLATVEKKAEPFGTARRERFDV